MASTLAQAKNLLSQDIGLDRKKVVDAVDLFNPERLALLREEDEQALELDWSHC